MLHQQSRSSVLDEGYGDDKKLLAATKALDHSKGSSVLAANFMALNGETATEPRTMARRKLLVQASWRLWRGRNRIRTPDIGAAKKA